MGDVSPCHKQAERKFLPQSVDNSFIKTSCFYPSKCKGYFSQEDLCLLRVFGSQQIIADFTIKSEKKTDPQGDIYYEIKNVTEWEYPIDIPSLPGIYSDLFDRNPVKEVNSQRFMELIGIRNFIQNLRLNYKNLLWVNLSEKRMEDILDSVVDPLKREGLEIVERQLEIHQGNIIDLICKDRKGDLVVVEIKKHGANETIGQLARYLTDVREKFAKPTQKVKGLILALTIDEQLIKAARAVDFDVMLYQITFV
jgi:Holliday junction resolvase-like predicted endonuclease